MTVVSPPIGSSAVATIVSEPPSTMLRARPARGARPGRARGERVDEQHGVAAAGRDAAGGVDRALDRLGLRVGRRRRTTGR
jgi:hypothetical protein